MRDLEQQETENMWHSDISHTVKLELLANGAQFDVWSELVFFLWQQRPNERKAASAHPERKKGGRGGGQQRPWDGNKLQAGITSWSVTPSELQHLCVQCRGQINELTLPGPGSAGLAVVGSSSAAPADVSILQQDVIYYFRCRLALTTDPACVPSADSAAQSSRWPEHHWCWGWCVCARAAEP